MTCQPVTPTHRTWREARNPTGQIRSRETFAEVSVPVPLSADLDAAIEALQEDVAGERDATST